MLFMHELFYIILLILHITDIGEAEEDRIVGGLEASSRDQFPFLAQLELILFKNESFTYAESCSSTLIHPQWILSAAYCFFSFNNQIEQLIKKRHLKVYAGTNKRYGQNAYINYIRAVFIHPNFNITKNVMTYNVAVAMLHKRYKVNNYVQPALLPEPREIGDHRTSRCKNGKIVGIGSIQRESLNFSPFVMYANVEAKMKHELQGMPLSDPPVDTIFYTEVKFLNGGNLLGGDFGGPFVCNYENNVAVVYGISSWEAASKTNGVFLNGFEEVDKHMEFILKKVPAATIYPESKVKRFLRSETQSANINSNTSSFYCIGLSLIFVVKNMV